MRARAWLAAACALSAACGGDNGSGPGATKGRIFVDSDPRGAAILLDGVATGQRTPDTLRNVTPGTRSVEVRLDSLGVAFSIRGDVDVPAGSAASVVMPLVSTCNASGNCVGQAARFHDIASLHFSTNPAAMPFFSGGRGGGLLYPGTSGDSYISAGAPVFAGTPSGVGGGVVALGVYPFSVPLAIPPLWNGRPAPPDTVSASALVLHQSTWIAPPAVLVRSVVPRGLQVDQRIVGRSDVDGALAIRVVFRNVSATPAYRFLDSATPAGGFSYTGAYVGYALDADIGLGPSYDDLYTFIPSLAMSVMYDGPLDEPGFGAPPALVGLRMLQPPAGAGNVALSAWLAGADWLTTDQPVGYNAITVGGKAGNPVFAAAPVTPGDYRISVAAGPLNLAPGDSAAFTVAVVLAPPAPRTYTPGTVLFPGDPNDPGRPFNAVAAPLVQRARAAEALLGR